MQIAPAILSGWFFVPLTEIPDPEALKRTLTFVPKTFGDADPKAPIAMYSLERRGYLGVPREYGLAHFAHLPLIDQTVRGHRIVAPRRPDPNHPRVRDPAAQKQFMDDLLAGYSEHRSYIAMAPTGSGKTTCALNTIAEIGEKALILVHLERLMHQWVEEIESKLGIPRERIGIIQQNNCEIEGKDICVGLLHSVVRRDYGPEFYNAFGIVVFDEVHKVGSEFFAPAVHKFPSRYRMGLSATPKRKDGGDRVFMWHLGPIRVTSSAEALPMTCYVMDYRGPKPWGSNHGARVKALTLDSNRNAKIVGYIKYFYDKNRNALVVSESVDHLQKLMAMCEKMGIPRSKMGQFTSMRHEVQRDPSSLTKIKVVNRKQSKEELDFVRENSQIIFATYGMMTEGIDIPRLDAGIDATPRSAATQLTGRIRRPMPGKRKPVWFTIRDLSCPMSVRYFNGRCKDYQSTNVEVVYTQNG